MKTRSRIQLVALLALVLSNLAIFGIPAHQTPRTPSTPTPTPKTLNDQSASSPIILNPHASQAPLIATVDLTNQPPQLHQSNPQPAGQQRQASANPLLTTTTSSSTAPAGNMTSNNVVASAGFEGLIDTPNPPDVSVAAGVTNVVETVNSEIGVYTKQGSQVTVLGLSQVFNSNDFLFDPKVLYDSSSRRFFASVGDGTIVSVLVAVSGVENPMTWKVYNLKTGIPLTDQPMIGTSDDKFVASANAYSVTSANQCQSPCPQFFLGAQTWVLNKAQMISGLPNVNMSVFGPTKTLMSLHPAQSQSSTSTLYVVSSGGSDLGNRDFHFFNVTGVPPGNVTIQPVPLSIATINPTVLAPQPGTTNLIDSGDGPAPGAGDARIQSAAWYKGQLWLTLADGCTPRGDNPNVTRACFRLTQIDTSVSPNVVRQDFDVGIAGLYLFYPALAFDNAGNLGVVYGFSSATNSTCCYPSLAVTGQATNDPKGSFRQPTIIKRGTAIEPTDRYGDYFGASVDPTDPTRLWVAGEYHRFSRWSTFIDSIRVKDFAISGVPPYVTFAPGSSKSSTLTLTSLGGFAGNVSLTATVSPLVSNGPTSTFTPSTLSLTPGSTRTSTFTLSSVSATPVGFYSVNVTGTSGTDIQLVNMTLRVGPDFTIAANTTTVTLQGGTSSTAPVSITITSLNNLVGAVNLTAIINPAGPSFALNPPSVSLTSGSTGTSTLIISISPSTIGGTYLVTVTGNSGPVTHSTALTVNVQDFTISISPTSLFIIVGNSANSTVTLTSLNGAFVVGLSATSSPAGPTLTLSPASVTLASGASGTSTLTVATSSTTPLGNYTITVTGTSGSHSRTATVIVKVSGDFTISASPTSMFLTSGQSGQSVITLTSIKGFSGTVSLSVSSFISASLNPTTVSLNPGGTATSTLTITGSAFGLTSVLVTGTSGPLSHTTGVSTKVGGFVCLANPDPTTFFDCPSASGSVFNGPVTHPATQLRVGMYASGSAASSGFDITLKTDSRALLPVDADFTGSVFPANFPVVTKCLGGVPVVGKCSSTDTADTLHFSALQFNFQTIQPLNGLLFTAVYNITGTTGGINVGFQTGCSNSSVDGGVCVIVYSPFFQFDFEQIKTASFANGNIPYVRLSASPNIMGPVLAFTPATATITATPVNGFPTIFDSGQVQFTATGSSTLSFSLNPNPVTIPQNQSTTDILTTTGTKAGNYTFTIFGTYEVTNSTGCPSTCISTLSSSITLRIIVQDVSITPNPSSLVLIGGSSGTSTLTFTSLNGFSGKVNITATVSPLLANGPTATLNPAVITLAPGGSANSTLVVSTTSDTTPRLYSIVVRATTGIGTRLRGIFVTVRGFSISANPNSLIMNTGTTSPSTITLASLNLFSGNVNLTLTTSSGLTANLGVSSLKLSAGGSNSTTLTITASIGAGNYTVTVTGTSGTLSHSTTISVRVTDFQISANQNTVVFPRGSSSNVTFTIRSLNGFNQTVTITGASTPAGPSASASPSSITLTPNGQATSTVTITATSSTLTGLYTLTLTGTSGSLPRSLSLLVAVTPITFPVNNSTVFTGIKLSTTGTITLDSPSNSLTVSGTISASATNATTGAAIFAKNYTITRINLQLQPSNIYQTRFILDVPAGPYPLSWNIIITLTTNTATTPGSPSTATTASRNPDILQHGIVDIVDAAYLAARFGCSQGQSCYDPRADLNANGIIDNPDVAIEQTFFGATDFNQMLFNIIATPASPTFNAGSSTTTTITVTDQNGFSGNVTLATLPSSGLNATLSKTSIIGSATSTMTLSTPSPGNYTVTVTATGSGESHSLTLTISVVGYTASANPTDLTLPPGSSGSSTITLTSINGFSGTVTLAATISPSGGKSPSVSISPVSVTLSKASSSTATLKVSTKSTTATGSYTITVSTTSGTESLSTPVFVCVPGQILPCPQAKSQTTANPARSPVNQPTQPISTATATNTNTSNPMLTDTINPFKQPPWQRFQVL